MDLSAGSYRRKKDSEKCPTSSRITLESICKKAADELGLSWDHSWHGPTDAPGCIFANDGRSKVYFNTVLNANGHNEKYAEICTTGEHLQAFRGTASLRFGQKLVIYEKIYSNVELSN